MVPDQLIARALRAGHRAAAAGRSCGCCWAAYGSIRLADALCRDIWHIVDRGLMEGLMERILDAFIPYFKMGVDRTQDIGPHEHDP